MVQRKETDIYSHFEIARSGSNVLANLIQPDGTKGTYTEESLRERISMLNDTNQDSSLSKKALLALRKRIESHDREFKF